MVKGDSCSESLAYSTPTCLPSEGHRDPREQEETEETGCWIPCLGSSLSRSVNAPSQGCNGLSITGEVGKPSLRDQ